MRCELHWPTLTFFVMRQPRSCFSPYTHLQQRFKNLNAPANTSTSSPKPRAKCHTFSPVLKLRLAAQWKPRQKSPLREQLGTSVQHKRRRRAKPGRERRRGWGSACCCSRGGRVGCCVPAREHALRQEMIFWKGLSVAGQCCERKAREG